MFDGGQTDNPLMFCWPLQLDIPYCTLAHSVYENHTLHRLKTWNYHQSIPGVSTRRQRVAFKLEPPPLSSRLSSILTNLSIDDTNTRQALWNQSINSCYAPLYHVCTPMERMDAFF